MTGVSHYYRPLQNVVYTAVYAIDGFSLVAFHALNLALHILNACLVYVLGLRLGFKPGAVLLAALLWALHPVQTEAVTYMSDTPDLMYVAFCLGGIILLQSNWSLKRVALSIVMSALALLSKEIAVIFPLLVMACLYLRDEQRFDWRHYLKVWPFFAVVALYGGLRMLVLNGHAAVANVAAGASDAPQASAGYEAFANLLTYLRLLVWPEGLHMEHDLQPHDALFPTAVGVGIVFVIGASLLVLGKQNPRRLALSWGLLWFAAALLPVFCIEGLLYEHWLYLPSAGLFLGVTQALALRFEQKPLMPRIAFGAGLAVFLGVLTFQQNRIWSEPVVFYNNIFAHGERAPKAHTMLGAYYTQHDNPASGIEQDQLALKFASPPLFSADDRAAAEANWGISLLIIGDSVKNHDAEMHLKRALDAVPDFYPALHVLSDLYASRGDVAQARLYQSRAEAAQPGTK